jgi:hypothetical protein
LANSKASRRVFFSAVNVPLTPSTWIARTTYAIPAFPEAVPHDHHDSANPAVLSMQLAVIWVTSPVEPVTVAAKVPACWHSQLPSS